MTRTNPSSPGAPAPNFIRAIVDRDLQTNKHGGRVATRFPPEPNGYLHIGHAKSICLNFGLARDIPGAVCHLRFDDTNPLAEDTSFVEAIQRDVRWLGFDWGDNLFFASDYFERLYQFAEELIQKGKAYVCSLSDAEAKRYRGTINEPGQPSPDRERPIADSLDLFRRMRAGEFKDGELVLRAKIDMTAANMKMRDPAIYRIRHARHHRTADRWCIYPLYDFTHCLSDALERVTHSICTLEFENNRELYDWFLDQLDVPFRPHQYEFAALNLSYTITSKRKCKELIERGFVSGWDDPRLPTLSGLRRRGYTPEAVRTFCDRVGVAKNNSVVDVGHLEFAIRDDLNAQAPRVMAVLEPLKIVLTTYPEAEQELIDAPYFPDDVPREGSRPLAFCRELWIERDDFQVTPEKGFRRLSPGREVRLRHAYVIRCDEVIKDAQGQVVELRCSHDPATLNDPPSDGRKVAGTIHWVSARHALPCELRLYDRLFSEESPNRPDGPDFTTFLNPDSLRVIKANVARVEPSVVQNPSDVRYQFERVGFFWQDPKDSKPDALVFNRIVSLKDSWAKVVEARATGKSTLHARQDERRKQRDEQKEAQSSLDRERAVELNPVAARYQAEHGIAASQAHVLGTNETLRELFDAALALGAEPKTLAALLVTDVARLLKEQPALPFGAKHLAELEQLLRKGTVSTRAAREVLQEMAKSGRSPQEIVAALDLQKLDDPAELSPIVDAVLTEFADKVAAYRAGNQGLLGLFVGQIMRRTQGKADPKIVNQLLTEKLGTPSR